MPTIADRPSLRAPSMVDDAAEVTPTVPRERRDVRRAMAKLPAEVRAWAQRFRVTLSEEERAHFDLAITASRAYALGSRVEPRGVVAEYLRLLEQLSPWILRSRTPPYGPRRTRYALELLSAVAPVLDGASVPVAAVPARDERPELTPTAHTRVMRTLSKLTAPAAAELEAARTTNNGRAASRHERTLARIAWARENVPAAVREDVGLSEATLGALEREATSVLDTREAWHTSTRGRRALRADVAERCGRIVMEIRALVAAARSNAADDGSIPAVRSRFVIDRASHAKKPSPRGGDNPVTPPTG